MYGRTFDYGPKSNNQLPAEYGRTFHFELRWNNQLPAECTAVHSTLN